MIFAISFFATMCVLLFVQFLIDKREIALLKERVRTWGACAYTFGYNDGRNAKKAQTKTQEEVLTEVEEIESATSTL